MVYYFAYGSNMDEPHLRSRGVVVKRKFLGKLDGWKLVFNKIKDDIDGVGFANIVPSKNFVVEGVVYQTDEASILILSRWEGCPIHYTKEKITVQDASGKSVKCVVYVANPKKKTADGLKPTKEYLSHLLNGKGIISSTYLKMLKRTPTIE